MVLKALKALMILCNGMYISGDTMMSLIKLRLT